MQFAQLDGSSRANQAGEAAGMGGHTGKQYGAVSRPGRRLDWYDRPVRSAGGHVLGRTGQREGIVQCACACGW